MSASLTVSQEGRLLRLRLNRPEKRNALDLELCRALVAAFDEAQYDDEIGAVLLTGSGPSFCAGMDLSEALEAEGTGQADTHERLFSYGARMWKPVVAAVEGAALAGGAGLVANAHIVVAAEDASFGLTEIRIGLWPFLVFRSVERAMGERRALELALSGRIFGASEALAYGLVHHLVPANDAERAAGEIATTLAGRSPSAISCGMQFAANARGRGETDATALARRFRAELFRGPDLVEGIRAFFEKREPRWPSLG